MEAHGTNPWRNRDFRLLWVGRLAAVLAIQTQGAALLWQVYDIARRDHPIQEASLYLGLIGLCQFLPLLALTLPAGEMADRLDRKRTVILSIAVEGLCAVIFLGLALTGHPPLWALLAVAALFGAARAFLAPASQAFLPMVVGRAALPRAIAAQSIAFQTGSIAAPAIAGLIVGIAVPYAYGASIALFLVGLACIASIRTSGKPRRERTPFSAKAMFDAVTVGLKYVWNTKVVLGAISLDLVVVLLAGVALLTPIFARDILHVGPEGFGLLRASFGVGALGMAIYLSRFPIVRHGVGQRHIDPDDHPAQRRSGDGPGLEGDRLGRDGRRQGPAADHHRQEGLTGRGQKRPRRAEQGRHRQQAPQRRRSVQGHG